VAFVMNLEASATDDALDLLDIIVSEIFAEAARASDRARLRTIKDMDSAALQLSQVCRFVLNEDLADMELRGAIFKALKLKICGRLGPGRFDRSAARRRVLPGTSDSYSRARRFLPTLLHYELRAKVLILVERNRLEITVEKFCKLLMQRTSMGTSP
jgi:hypothetical protein